MRGECVEGQRRLAARLVAAVPVEARVAERHVLLRPGEAQRIDAGVAEHRVERPDDRLIDVGLFARGIERHRADDLVVLRRGFTQPADAPRVIVGQLLVGTDDERIERRRL